jgi:hypothetical protein
MGGAGCAAGVQGGAHAHAGSLFLVDCAACAGTSPSSTSAAAARRPPHAARLKPRPAWLPPCPQLSAREAQLESAESQARSAYTSLHAQEQEVQDALARKEQQLQLLQLELQAAKSEQAAKVARQP